ncbi:MazF family toxin-antitoxin system [Clostridia bacterium]|nr:MazF family toxin-antitoxin system [Clostridia bacterium]
MSAFEIYVYYVSWGINGKSRPVLFFSQEDEKVSIFTITTKYETKSDKIRAYFFKIVDWAEAGLSKQSYIDTLSINEVSVDLLKNPIGKLTERDRTQFFLFLAKHSK